MNEIEHGATSLDFCCGSGRDTKYFRERGYQVTAIDGSKELCKRASEYTGITVKHMLFQELNEIEASPLELVFERNFSVRIQLI